MDAMAGGCPEPRVMAYRPIRDTAMNAMIDRGLVVWFPGPSSFTGEDSAEFHIHGGRAVVARLMQALGRLPRFRVAEAGEFATRAFHAGKMDLTEAEGLADLIDAETEAQRLQALRQADGALAKLYGAWRERIIEACALMEAAIDFSDEGDVSDQAVGQAMERVAALSAEISEHLNDNRHGEIIREGFRVVLAGPVNAGKSSFLNWLTKRDVAIVSEEPGTTRDVIEVKLDLDGLPIVICDTAGFRQTDGSVEREGIRRSTQQMNAADLVLWMVPIGTKIELPETEAAECLGVQTKLDTEPAVARDLKKMGLRMISVKSGVGLEDLRQDIIDIAMDQIGSFESPVLTQSRHRLHLETCIEHLGHFFAGEEADTELRAEDLRQAANALGRITGRVDAEDVLDQIFGRFCIGK